MKIAVTTTAQRLPAAGTNTVLLQNRGPDHLYMDATDDVSPATGIVIEAGDTYEFPGDLAFTKGSVWLVSAGSSDLRWMQVG